MALSEEEQLENLDVVSEKTNKQSVDSISSGYFKPSIDKHHFKVIHTLGKYS